MLKLVFSNFLMKRTGSVRSGEERSKVNLLKRNGPLVSINHETTTVWNGLIQSESACTVSCGDLQPRQTSSNKGSPDLCACFLKLICYF